MNLFDSPSNLTTVSPMGTEPPPYWYGGYDGNVSSGFCDWYWSSVDAWHIWVMYNVYCDHSNESRWLQTASFPPYDPELVDTYRDVDTNDSLFELIITIISYANDYFQTPFSIIVSGLGIVGNAIILVIFRRLGVLTDGCTPILVGLAASDFTYCFLAFVMYWFHASFLILPEAYDHQLLPVISSLLNKPMPCLIQFTCWGTTLLAFERMISVVFPFHVKRIFTPKRSCAITGGIFVLSFLAYLHRLLHTYLDYSDPNYGVKWTLTGYVSNMWMLKAEFANGVVLRIVSIASVIAFNLIIIIRVNALNKFKTSNTSSAPGRNRHRENNTKKETRLTRLMIYMCVLFLVCYIPRPCFNLAGHNRLNMSREALIVIQSLSFQLFTLLELVNSAVTFLVYNKMSSKFKMERRKLCLGCRKSNDDNND